MKYSQNIYKDFVKLFVPILVVFFLLFLTNIIDTFFASRISVEALAAMQAVFPLFFFLLSINEGFSTATNNLISIALGEKNEKKKNIYFTIGVLLALIVGGLLFVISDVFV
jgi:Na+-driven multidrug efflux pump